MMLKRTITWNPRIAIARSHRFSQTKLRNARFSQAVPRSKSSNSTTKNASSTQNSSDLAKVKRQRASQDIEIPSFSFEGLGATPGIKIVLYTALAILASLETYFYGRWIYHYFYPDSTPEASHYLKGLYRYFFPVENTVGEDDGGKVPHDDDRKVIASSSQTG